MTNEEAIKLFKDRDLVGRKIFIDEAIDLAIEALEKVEQLEEENKEMKRALNLFCSEFMCRECLFLDKENKQCTISKLFFDEKGQIK